MNHDEFMRIYYDVITNKTPFTYKCRGQSITFFGDNPVMILEADYKNNRFAVYPSTGS